MKGAVRDPITVQNERTKLFANWLNALSLGMIGFAVLRPAIEDIASASWQSAFWAFAALAIHGAAHYILGRRRKEDIR